MEEEQDAQFVKFKKVFRTIGFIVVILPSSLGIMLGDIRLAASSPEAQDPMKWRGQNLLGFALMEVRDELRRVTQNEMLCDWNAV